MFLKVGMKNHQKPRDRLLLILVHLSTELTSDIETVQYLKISLPYVQNILHRPECSIALAFDFCFLPSFDWARFSMVYSVSGQIISFKMKRRRSKTAFRLDESLGKTVHVLFMSINNSTYRMSALKSVELLHIMALSISYLRKKWVGNKRRTDKSS